MRPLRILLVLAFCGPAARAADPVTVTLNETAAVGKRLVTLGDVALVTGGDAATRARVGGIDLAELKAREPGTAVGRKSVEYRLLLAGFEAGAVRVTGAEKTNVTLSRRAVTLEEVTGVARAELLRQIPNPESVVVELAVPLAAKLPDVPADESATITAKPRGKPGASGRVQMDMSVAVGGETLLSFALHLGVQPAPKPAVAPAGGTVPVPTIPPLPGAPRPPVPPLAPPAPAGEPLIRPRQRVEMQVNSGALKVTAVGEAQQAGALGQTILVQNVDSKKTLSARVTGPGTVEIDLGGPK